MKLPCVIASVVSVALTAIPLASLLASRQQPESPTAEPELLELSGSGGVHDPVMMKQGETYYLFCTGGNRRGGGIVTAFTSPNMREWSRAGYALSGLPDWVAAVVPRARDAWAPDIAHFNDKYYLYYSVSTFGQNTSAIGLATNKTLAPQSPDYEWVDQGMVVRSRRGEDDFNAIDPNLVVEDDQNVWLSWGSYWGGIMMRRVDPATGKLSETDTTLHKLARRAQGSAIEAPFIVRRGDQWYLFVSWDRCCRGPRSNYKVAVGRSDKVTGPYVDKEGKPMSEGGGTMILEAETDNWRGAGHQAVYQEDGTDYLLFHSYPAVGRGSNLHISTIVWEDGWPRVAKMP